MLLIDLSSIVVGATIELLAQNKDEPVNERLIRHIGLTQILYYKKKFKKYGHPILCADTKNYWRKDVFPYYKQNRKKVREDSIIDWKKFFQIFDEFKIELQENFPFSFIEVPRVEADDILAVMAWDAPRDEDVMIVSSDKDMIQLQTGHPNIKQFSPSAKKQISKKTNDYDLLTHIIKGDTGDGIPNIYSDDDTLVTEGKRQKSVFAKKIAKIREWEDPLDGIPDSTAKKKFKRNRLIIDMSRLPQRVTDWIHAAIEADRERPRRAKMYHYFTTHGMKQLLDRIEEFK